MGYFNTLLKVSNRPLGENMPNLVTLLRSIEVLKKVEKRS
jgi:hypothetical protein